jgi:hypothetical protein
MFDKLYISLLKCIPILLCIGAVFWAGYYSRGIYDEDGKLRQEAVLKAKSDSLAKQEAAVASELQSRLDALQKASDAVQKVVVREVQKPIYLNKCFEDSGVALINNVAKGNKQ